ncbi:hypothetical protein ES754_02955 [Psychrobacter frigidicola]|uniref:Alkaline proteinase inhibitor/ Outer membrane lipoprotein Omp19 domain-containing protein n=1 Tax=Psychrobacter frigidicola TaxID=45611 RepID=A0A5C7A3Y5_9GAMM|nr:hypothetical protein [Psychrobacter frigidicola]TXD97932.1 hypothetical protein ES754_02955 [Psychrobacter frigidicola]
MALLSVASFTLASILSSLPTSGEQVSQSQITTHISPAIAGQWEIDLDSVDTMSKPASRATSASTVTAEPRVSMDLSGGVLDQSQQRIISIVPKNTPNSSSNTIQLSATPKKPAQCRELYNFAADNEMWAVSGKEWTYGRYLVTHREEGLPIIAIKTVYDNNEVDCSGNQIDQTDEALIAFLHHDGNKMQWCADSEGKECFMSFHRILP